MDREAIEGRISGQACRSPEVFWFYGSCLVWISWTIFKSLKLDVNVLTLDCKTIFYACTLCYLGCKLSMVGNILLANKTWEWYVISLLEHQTQLFFLFFEICLLFLCGICDEGGNHDNRCSAMGRIDSLSFVKIVSLTTTTYCVDGYTNSDSNT